MGRVRNFGLETLMVFAGGGKQMGPPTSRVTTLTLADNKTLVGNIPAIAGSAPFYTQAGQTVKFRDRTTIAPIFGVTRAWEWVWDWHTSEGRFVSQKDEQRMVRTVVIGQTTKQELFEDTDPIGEQIRIGNVPFQVVGVMKSRGTSPGGMDMDNHIFVPLSTMRRRLANVDYITGIKLLLHGNQDIKGTATSIKEMLRERHHLSPGEPDDFRVITPDEATQIAGKVTGTFNIFLVLVAGISLIAGGFVIANIMLISVSERRGEIGLRKAVGADRRNIRFQFLLESIAVTITGGIIGVLLGFAGATLLGRLMQLPVAISWVSVVIGVVFSGMVGIIAGLQPASQAARMQPVEALRG